MHVRYTLLTYTHTHTRTHTHTYIFLSLLLSLQMVLQSIHVEWVTDPPLELTLPLADLSLFSYVFHEWFTFFECDLSIDTAL